MLVPQEFSKSSGMRISATCQQTRARVNLGVINALQKPSCNRGTDKGKNGLKDLESISERHLGPHRHYHAMQLFSDLKMLRKC